MNMGLSFKGTIRRSSANSYCVTVPKQYLKDGLLHVKETYRFEIIEQVS
jgi:hypothetical protein